MSMRRASPVATVLLSLVLLVGVAGCGDGKAPAKASPVPVDFSQRGPYAVGITTLDLGDRIAYVFYPADPSRLGEGTRMTSYDAADAFPASFRSLVPSQLVPTIAIDATRAAPVATDGPFPVVLYSHGFGSYPEYSSLHLIQLASWGFVVAAPDHLERDIAAVAAGTAADGTTDVRDLRATLARLRTENESGPFRDALDLDHVAAEGHSSGGAAAARIAYDPGITTFIGQAPDVPVSTSPDASATDIAAALATQAPPAKPSMLLVGERDSAVPPAGVEAEYSWLAGPKWLAVIGRAGHNSFTDLCGAIRDQGGLMQFSGVLPVPDELLAEGENGCTAADLDPAAFLAVVDQLTVAQLRYVFGIDATDVSLSREWMDHLFPGVLTDYEYQP
jgi:dienelactone hydrolase